MTKIDIRESEIQIAHLNANMGIRGVRDNIKDSVYGTLSFFLSRSPDSIKKHSDIAKIVDPLIQRGGDVLCFSEVFGIHQLDYVCDALEKRGYKTITTEAFEMWSQDVNKEHLYNIVGIRSSYPKGISVNNVSSLRNKRILEGCLIALAYIIRSDINTLPEKIAEAKRLYGRLIDGIMDGAITTIDVGDSLKFSHLHIHADNPALAAYFQGNVFESSPHVMIGDFNIGNIYDLLSKPPFSGKGYSSFLPDGSKTFPFARGLDNIGKLFHSTPDDIIGNRLIGNKGTSTFTSNSDHNGLISRIKIK